MVKWTPNEPGNLLIIGVCMRIIKSLMLALLLLPALASAEQQSDFAQAIEIHSSNSGGNLASAPKIRPDGQLYHMSGRIQDANDIVIFASLTSIEKNELLLRTLQRAQGVSQSTEYFAVVIPQELEDYYFDNAKIGGGFDLIGRYIQNTEYETVIGQTKRAPVFEAVYLDLWSNRQRMRSSRNASTEVAEDSAYEQCMEDAMGITESMIECSNSEWERQDKRLNAAYKSAMASTQDKNALRAIQREWIKERDSQCKDDGKQGQSGALVAADCMATKTALRADELELIAQ